MAKNLRALRREEPESMLSAGLKGLGAMTAAAVGGWIVYSNLAIDHNVMLPEAVPGERKVYESQRAGRLSYYFTRSQTGRPLVLIHSVNAAASAYEMRPLFLQYRDRRPVFALELPGFGFSERSDRIYTPRLYEEAVLDFLSTQVGEPADVVALSLSCEFAARAAMTQPELFNSLALISPTGFDLGKGKRSSQQVGRSGGGNFLHSLLAVPLWSRPFYDALTTRSSIEYFLKQSFVDDVPQDLIDYDYATAHQPGAEHAPLYFISGKLFTLDIRESVYNRLQVPTLVIYDRDNFTGFELLPETLATNNYWQAVRLVPSLGMLHFEQTEDTVEVLNNFWK